MRDGTVEPVLPEENFRREREQGTIHFPCLADHEQDWQLHTISGCGKERRILISPWGSAKAAPARNYLEVYWPYAGGLSAVNAIG